MSLYDLPEIKIKKLPAIPPIPKLPKPKVLKSRAFWLVILTILISSFFGFLAGSISGSYFYLEIKDYLDKLELGIELPEPQIIEREKIIEKIIEYKPQTSQEQAIINAVKEISPAVVSIVITKDVPIVEQYYISPFDSEFFNESPFQLQIPQLKEKGTEKKEVGSGTGFIVSENGMILTNKHVVLDEQANYTVFTNDGKKFPAKVLARDKMQDLAIMKIDQEKKIDNNGEVF